MRKRENVSAAPATICTTTTARKPKSSKDIIGLADAPSDDLRPSSEDTRRTAVIIAEAHRGVPDDGAVGTHLPILAWVPQPDFERTVLKAHDRSSAAATRVGRAHGSYIQEMLKKSSDDAALQKPGHFGKHIFTWTPGTRASVTMKRQQYSPARATPSPSV